MVNAAGDTDSYTIASTRARHLPFSPTRRGPSSPRSRFATTPARSSAAPRRWVRKPWCRRCRSPPPTRTRSPWAGQPGSAGTYALTLILNAAVELEPIGVPGDNTIADAQNIDASFTDLIKGATRGAVLGLSGDTDVYSFQLEAGQALSADLVFQDTTGPPVFGPRTDYSEYLPVWVALGDVNDDDKLDMVDASYYGGYLSVRLGNGDGTFGDPSTFGFGSNLPQQIALADLDGDGELDVVSSNYSGGTNGTGSVTVMRGHGDGTFDPAVGYFAGYSNVALALGDVNSDGRPDIVTTSANDSTVQVLLNNGDGTFGAASVYAVGASSQWRGPGRLQRRRCPRLGHLEL